ncbi:hypothetical protein ANTQUA_LOCUS10250 [Anthophora quadrimaculata]
MKNEPWLVNKGRNNYSNNRVAVIDQRCPLSSDIDIRPCLEITAISHSVNFLFRTMMDPPGPAPTLFPLENPA